MADFIVSHLPDFIASEMTDMDSKQALAVCLGILVILLILLVLYGFIFFMMLKLNRKIFKRIEKKKGSNISIQFLQKAVALALIIIFIVLPLGGQKLATSLLGSTAVVAAVVGLAANDVIKNMFAGLEISIYKPFDVGSRIMLNDGRTGIVEKLTLRHVVLQLVDTTRLIIPNSQANTAIITNYSYAEHVPRSLELRFPVSYSADIEEAKKVIRETICSCPLTLNEDRYKENDPNSRSVYFLELKDSSVILGATVYYPHKVRTEVVKDEVNTAIFNALAEHGIEIPYNYVNVVMKKDTEDQ